MDKLDGMLMVGSAGRNIGKTELACSLIRKFVKDKDITGVKVTTIKLKDGQCPRGGQGCGVCSSLEGDWAITQETDSSSGKDTARLLAAGASRVFWLRVMDTHLKEGLVELMRVIGSDAVSVCESNSLREVVEPGVFVIVRGKESKSWKNSAQQVRRYADRVVTSDGSEFDFDIDQIKLVNGKWTIAPAATAIIMAGGKSSRMDVDKSMLLIKGRPIIEVIYEQLRGTFGEIVISANGADKYAFVGAEVVKDKVAGQGPLMGIASAMEASGNELNFVAACDIPYIDINFVKKMLDEAKGEDIIIPADDEGKYEPLFAVYRKSTLEAMNKVLEAGKRKISDVFDLCRVKYIKLEAEKFTNLNTKTEYEKFQKECDAEI